MRLVGAVRDTGVGIAESAKSSLFERYMQADANAERRAQGTGLGLAIARRLAQAMGGDIDVASTLGVGSVFTFQVETQAGGERPAAPRVVAPSVVVATPSVVLSRVLRLQLETFGARDIFVCDDARDAEAALRDRPGAALICDYPLVEECAKGALGAASRALVLLSPTQRASIEAMRARGFDGYLIKPVRQSTLMREVARSLGNEAPASAAVARPAEAARSLKVLLAEDNQINAVLATTLIRRAGHKVDVAPNGEEAVRSAAAGDYDVIFMDMHMPVMDGLEASRRIRALASSAGKLPIIALTANATATDRQRCMAAGMNDFLSKPFEASDLNRMLTKWGAGVAALVAAS
jgi:CheY-like chemotaxis protein